MRLSPHEQERLLVHVAADVARADKDDIVSQIRRFFGGK